MSSYSNFNVDLTNKNSSWTILYHKINKGSSVLDIGCSSGYFDEVLIRQKECVVDGIELDPADAKRAKKICRKVIEGNVESNDFPWHQIDQKYDYILFIDVLEHLLDPARTLQNVSKLLKKNGSILFSIPNMANGSVRLQLLQGNFDYEKEGLLDETHLHYYTDHTITKMVQASKLKLTDIDFTTFDTPRSTIRAVMKRVGLASTSDFEEYLRSGTALIYQYIGTVKVSGTSITLPTRAEAIKPKIDYEIQLADVQDDTRKVFKNLTDANDIINKQHADIVALKEEIDLLKNEHPVKKIKRAVREIIKQ